MKRSTTTKALATLTFGLLILAHCSDATQTVCNPCVAGTVNCVGGKISTCQNVQGCLEFTKPTACPSGLCSDGTTCAPPANCGAFNTCETCAAPMTPGCFWCPTTSSCVATVDSACPDAVPGGNNGATVCAETTSCAPCALGTITVCPDTGFQCTCGTGQVPTDKACSLYQGGTYCCSS